MRTWARRGDHVVVVLPRGAAILEGIETAARQSGIASGAFVGLGAIEDPVLAWFDREAKEYSEVAFEGVWEIVNL
ncbi:MAG: DNA-binding protein, partial [Gemmatimonadetes bacterium]|nr:DNA-binding protein [Gemmatimonadota bacterium]